MICFPRWYYWWISVLYLACQSIGNDAKDHYVQQLGTPEIRIQAGTPALATVRFRVTDGYHITADTGVAQNQLPAVLQFPDQAPVYLHRITFPEPNTFQPKGLTSPLQVFDELFAIGLQLRGSNNAKSGRYKLQGELFYQACNDRQCFFPKKLPVTIVLVVD